MNWHGYIGIENVGLTEDQRDTMVDWFKSLGRADNSPFPHLRTQTRIRLDNDAAIVEAVFRDDWLSVDFVKNKLADVFGVDPATIDSDTSQTQYGPMVVFSRPAGTDRLRMLLFGGVGAEWETSRLACVAYLSANVAEWEESA